MISRAILFAALVACLAGMSTAKWTKGIIGDKSAGEKVYDTRVTPAKEYYKCAEGTSIHADACKAFYAAGFQCKCKIIDVCQGSSPYAGVTVQDQCAKQGDTNADACIPGECDKDADAPKALYPWGNAPYALDFTKCGYYGYKRVDGCDIAKYATQTKMTGLKSKWLETKGDMVAGDMVVPKGADNSSKWGMYTAKANVDLDGGGQFIMKDTGNGGTMEECRTLCDLRVGCCAFNYIWKPGNNLGRCVGFLKCDGNELTSRYGSLLFKRSSPSTGFPSGMLGGASTAVVSVSALAAASLTLVAVVFGQ